MDAIGNPQLVVPALRGVLKCTTELSAALRDEGLEACLDAGYNALGKLNVLELLKGWELAADSRSELEACLLRVSALQSSETKVDSAESELEDAVAFLDALRFSTTEHLNTFAVATSDTPSGVPGV